MDAGTVGLIHIGATWSGLAHYVHIRCRPGSYLRRQDFEPLFDAEHVTCLECLTDKRPMNLSEGMWREVQRVR